MRVPSKSRQRRLIQEQPLEQVKNSWTSRIVTSITDCVVCDESL